MRAGSSPPATAAGGADRRRRQQAPPSRTPAGYGAKRLRRSGAAASAAWRPVRLLRRRPGRRARAARDTDLSEHRPERALSLGLRQAVRRLLLSDQLLDLCQQPRARRRRCQSSCAAPAELYVYRNPGQEIEQAISVNGSAYMDLPVALKFRKAYVNGCSCKQAEYNPTEIEEGQQARGSRSRLSAGQRQRQGQGRGEAGGCPRTANCGRSAGRSGGNRQQRTG